MAGVHGLEHIQSLSGAHLPQNDAIRPHPQGVLYQIPLRDFTHAFQVGRTRFQADDMFLLQLQFRRIFDGDDAFRELKLDMTLSMVVLPLPVPPAIKTFSRARTRPERIR
jgi:hypothetical protein